MRLVEAPAAPVAEPDHGVEFDRWTFESTEPLSLDALRGMVRRELPGAVYRLKRSVHASEDPEHRHLVHTVGRRSEVRRHDPWGDRPPATRLVAIAAAGMLDEHWLHDAISRCAHRAELASSELRTDRGARHCRLDARIDA